MIAICKVIYNPTKNPSIIAIVTGDSNYEPVVTAALECKWRVETWF